MILDDPGLSSIAVSLVVDFGLFLSLFIVFAFLRKCRSKQVVKHFTHYTPKNPVYSESDTPLFELLGKVYNTSLSEVYELCGLEAYLYILLLKQILVVISIMSFFGFIVLVPVYLKGHSEELNLLEKTGIGHVLKDDSFMGTVIVFYIFFSILGYTLVYYVLKESDAKVPNIHNYAIEIKGIPPQLSPEKATKLLEEKLFPEFKEEIALIYVVSDFTDSYKDYLKIQKAVLKLQLYKDHHTSYQHRIKLRKKYYTRKVDAIEYYTEKIHMYNEDYLDHLKQGYTRNTGFAYLICYSESYANRVIQSVKRGYDSLNSLLWSVKAAPAPHEIKWENMVSNYLILRGREFCLMVGFIILFFIVLTPTAFSSLIETVFEDLTVNTLLEGFISKYVPTIILILYQAVLLKQVITFMVDHEKHTNSSSEILSSLVKYLLFMGFYTLFYPMIGVQALSWLSMIVEGDFDSWREKIANSLVFSGSFFTIYIIQKTFITMGVDLLQLGRIFKTKLQALLANTDKQKQMAYEAEPFLYGFEFSSSLTSFMIIMCFSVSFPIISFFGLLYFAVRVIFIQLSVHKYVILCVASCKKASNGVALSKMCLKSLSTSIFIFQFVTSTVIILNASTLFIRIAGVLSSIGFIIYIFLFFNAFSWYKDDKERELTSLAENTYMHPIERMETLPKFNTS